MKWGAIGGTISTSEGFFELDEFSTFVEMVGDNDCQPYMPTEAGDSFSDDWSMVNERDEHLFTVPSDPGGGYVTVTLSTNGPAIPWLTVTNAADEGGAISAGSAAQTSDEQKIISVFEAAPGQTYKLEVYEFFNAPAEEHPWPYSLSWSFTSRVDCYEPNDAFALDWPEPTTVAKAIPFGGIISAYSIAGYVLNGIGSGLNTYDWYRFSLTNTETVTVEMPHLPSDQKATMRLFSQVGAQTLSAGSLSHGEPIQMGPALLSPGDWYIEVHWSERGEGEVRPLLGEEIPDHFNTPYWLSVETEADQSFWDSFETGDRSNWDAEAP